MTIETEAYNVTPPLKNSQGMTCIAVLVASQTSAAVDLQTLFGAIDNGHFLTLEADGGKVYVAFGSVSGTINEQAQGTSVQACFPIPDGTQLPVRLVQGRERATGYATQTAYRFLHYKCPLSGVATAYLRVYRSSLAEGQGSEQFPPMGF